MDTTVDINSPQAVKRWATAMAVDYAKALYFNKFVSKNENSIIQEKTELEKAAGDRVQYDLSMRLREKPVYGDERLDGKAEELTFLTDEIKIDQMRKAMNTGGRMTKQRTLHDLRAIARARGSEYMAEWTDEAYFAYLSGDVGLNASNEDAIFTEEFAGNPIEAPDAAHMAYGGLATSKATLTSADVFTVNTIERVNTRAAMLNATNPNVVAMQPVRVGSNKHFVTLISPAQEYSLRSNTSEKEWRDIQMSAGQRGQTNPIFTDKMGMIGNTVIHTHANVRRFKDYGAGGNVEAYRALYLGRQAGAVAYGKGTVAKMTWVEESKDFGNVVEIACGMICGMKKTRYKARGASSGSDFGVMAIDTAAQVPN